MTPRLHVGLLATHPIQYYVPWYRALAKAFDLEVFFSHRQTGDGQSDAGFGVPFEWDIPMFDGYSHTFLENVARKPDVNRFFGCDTPGIRKVIRERQFDAFIVHGWATKSYWQAIQTCWRTDTPVLVRGDSTLHTPRPSWRKALKYPIHRWFVPKFDGYLAVGQRATHYLMHYGATADKCFESPHAVDNDRFKSQAAQLISERATLRREFNLEADSVVFLFVGKFIGLKRPQIFVDAIARAAAQGANVAGLMVGDGPLRSEIEMSARARGVRVSFAGFVNQSAMSRVYAAADVLVMPSAHETWGLVVNEAMASGLPAVVSNGVGCSDDLVLPGQTGERFEVDDRSALAAHIMRLAQDVSYRHALAAAAQRHIEKFSISAAVGGTLRAIEQVGRHRPADAAASSLVTMNGASR